MVDSAIDTATRPRRTIQTAATSRPSIQISLNCGRGRRSSPRPTTGWGSWAWRRRAADGARACWQQEASATVCNTLSWPRRCIRHRRRAQVITSASAPAGPALRPDRRAGARHRGGDAVDPSRPGRFPTPDPGVVTVTNAANPGGRVFRARRGVPTTSRGRWGLVSGSSYSAATSAAGRPGARTRPARPKSNDWSRPRPAGSRLRDLARGAVHHACAFLSAAAARSRCRPARPRPARFHPDRAASPSPPGPSSAAAPRSSTSLFGADGWTPRAEGERRLRPSQRLLCGGIGRRP